SVEEDAATDRQNAVTSTRAPNTALAERTANVVSEIKWFVRDYPEAMDRLQAAMSRIESLARERAGESEITLTEARRLESNVEAQVGEVEDAPHFGIHNVIRERTRTHTGTAIRFARRGDTDRVREELRRLAEYAAGFTTDIFVQQSLPRHPITNILVRMLRKGEYDPAAPFLFQIRHVASGFTSYAYETHPDSPGPYDLSRPAVSDRAATDVSRTYAPLGVGRGRECEI
ncbi:MAG: hypothetical protein ABEI99_02045, partial [Halobaculum sp.]